jgi:hypothetical protein
MFKLRLKGSKLALTKRRQMIRLLAEVGNREQGTEADKTEHLQEVY